MTARRRSSSTVFSERQRRVRQGFVLALLFLLAFFLFLMESHRLRPASEAALQVWIFDIGQGDAIFIQTPTGEQLLIDAGPDQRVLSKLGSVMFPWDRTIDAIILTHPHADHVMGFLDVLTRYQVARVYETGAVHSTEGQEQFEKAVQEEGAEKIFVQDDMTIMLGELTLEVIAPDRSWLSKTAEDPNASSVVLLLRYGATSILLTGDATEGMEKEILPDLSEPVDVLKVAHHGSAYSTSQAFLEQIQPRYALISVGKNNYGHPHPVLLDRLKKQGAVVYRTDQDGDLLIQSIGGEPSVSPAPLPF